MPTASRRSVARATKPKGFSLGSFTPDQSEKAITVKVSGQSLHLVFDTANLTMQFQAELEAAAEAQSLVRMQDLLFGQVREWDLLDEDGELMPITPASWRRMPMQLFGVILEKFGEEVRAPKTETSNS